MNFTVKKPAVKKQADTEMRPFNFTFNSISVLSFLYPKHFFHFSKKSASMKRKPSKPVLLTLVVILMVSTFSAAGLASSGSTGAINYAAIYTGKNIYRNITDRLTALHESNPGFTDLFNAGKSWDGRNIPVFRIGNGSRRILIDAEHHSREYITSILTLNQIEYLINAYKNNQVIFGYNARYLLETVSLWFVPMVNPDGIELCTRGNSAITNWAIKSGIPYKSSWTDLKDNARGVNLNKNYDTEWGKSKLNSKIPFSSKYPGTKAFSELESQAVQSLCQQYRFDMYLTYHCAGEIITWYYNQQGTNTGRDNNIAAMLSAVTGYKLITSNQSLTDPERGGGSREWFINAFKKPGFTIEIGKGSVSAPLNFGEYETIWNKNKNIPIQAAIADLKYVAITSDSSYKAVVNDLLQKSDWPKPLKDKDGLWLPLRQVSEALELQVTWDQTLKAINLESYGYNAQLNQNSRIAIVEGTPVVMPHPVKVINNNSYISAESLKAIAGLSITTHNSSGNVYINGSCQPIYNNANNIEKLFPSSRFEGTLTTDTPLYTNITDKKSQAVLKVNTKLTIIDQEKDYYNVKCQDGAEGWIEAESVSVAFAKPITQPLEPTQFELEIYASFKQLDSSGSYTVMLHQQTRRAAVYEKSGNKWSLIKYLRYSLSGEESGNSTSVLSFPLSQSSGYCFSKNESASSKYPLKIAGSQAQWFIDSLPDGTSIYVY